MFIKQSKIRNSNKVLLEWSVLESTAKLNINPYMIYLFMIWPYDMEKSLIHNLMFFMGSFNIEKEYETVKGLSKSEFKTFLSLYC